MLHKVSFSTGLTLVLLALGACGDSAAPDAGSADSDLWDVTSPDTSGPSDVGVDPDVGEPDAGSPVTCAISRYEQTGAVEEATLDELSGLAASLTQPGVYFAINDSGGPVLFALDEAGEGLASYRLEGADNYDFEDIAVGPGPDGEPWVFIGDVGDNMARLGGTPRAEIQVYAVPEPIVGASPSTLSGVRTLRFRHPGSAYDVEALAVDRDGSLVMITKEADRGQLLRGAMIEGPSELEIVLEFPIRGLVTGMDIGARGVLVRTYPSVYFYGGPEGAASLLALEPVRIQPGPEVQGEAVGWRADGTGFLTISEGLNAPVFTYSCD